jgi:hypothetical protein
MKRREYNMIRTATFLGIAIIVICSCGSPPVSTPPVTSVLVYDVPKDFSTNCSPNVSCIDFDGVASFNNGGAGTCTDQTFYFDKSSWLSLVIHTQFISPPQQVVVYLSETDPNGQPIQNPWTLTLQSGVPTDTWPFMFRVVPQAASDLTLTQGARIGGHYTLTALGSFDVTASTIEIYAQKTVVGTATHLCSAN